VRLRTGILAVGLAGGASFAWASAALAQDLADFDYENLAFRGFGLEAGYVWPNKVEPTATYGVRMDLGYLGPGLRIAPSITYWSSRMKAREVGALESRLDSLIAQTQPGGVGVPVSLGPIEWSDLALALDAHVVWRVPYGFLTFAGAGASVHFLNGAGDAIAGTFVEDLLDSVSAGVGLQAGVEVPVRENLRFYGAGRLELLEDLRYAALRGGLQLHFGGAVPGEESLR
jgi:hypothetical protein